MKLVKAFQISPLLFLSCFASYTPVNAGSFHLHEEQASIFPSGLRAAFSKRSYTSLPGFQACFSGAFFLFFYSDISVSKKKNKMQKIVSTILEAIFAALCK